MIRLPSDRKQAATEHSAVKLALIWGRDEQFWKIQNWFKRRLAAQSYLGGLALCPYKHYMLIWILISLQENAPTSHVLHYSQVLLFGQ